MQEPEEEVSAQRRKLLKITGAASVAGISGLAGCVGGDDSGNGNGGNGGDNGEEEVTTWTINGAGEGSPANTWMEAIATVVGDHTDTLELSPQLSNGVLRSAVGAVEGDVGPHFQWSNYTFDAQNDRGQFSEDGDVGPLEEPILGLLPTLHQGYWWCATYTDRDDINDIHDLAGKEVSLHLRGEPQNLWFKQVIESAGVENVTYRNDDFPNSQQAIQGRQVDAALVLAINGRILPPPHAEAFAAQDMKGVQIPEEDLEAAKEENELINWGTVSNDDLNEPGQFESVNSLLLASHVAGPAWLDSDLVYEMVSIIMENQEELGPFHPILEEFGLGEDRLGFEGIPDVEWHEGAVRYFDEEGIDYPSA